MITSMIEVVYFRDVSEKLTEHFNSARGVLRAQRLEAA